MVTLHENDLYKTARDAIYYAAKAGEEMRRERDRLSQQGVGDWQPEIDERWRHSTYVDEARNAIIATLLFVQNGTPEKWEKGSRWLSFPTANDLHSEAGFYEGFDRVAERLRQLLDFFVNVEFNDIATEDYQTWLQWAEPIRQTAKFASDELDDYGRVYIFDREVREHDPSKMLAKPEPPVESEPERGPSFNPDTLSLMYQGTEICAFKTSSFSAMGSRPEVVLTAFESNGWPEWIEVPDCLIDPLEPKAINNLTKYLNSRIKEYFDKNLSQQGKQDSIRFGKRKSKIYWEVCSRTPIAP